MSNEELLRLTQLLSSDLAGLPPSTEGPVQGAEDDVTRKRGGQPGNQNARRHGFYSDCLSPSEQALLETAGDARPYQ